MSLETKIGSLIKYSSVFLFTTFIVVILGTNNVLAAAGDFATFREATGGENIAQSASITDITWDTTVVDDTSTYTLQGNNFDINLGDAGHYLVLYSIPTYEVTTTNSERTDSIAWLELAGTDLAYGYSQGYIRRQSSNFEGYNAGAAIIEATSGQNISLEMQRRDTNTDTLERRPNKSGISLLKLDDTWDYLRLRLANRSADISGNTTFFDVSWDTQDEVDTGSYAHSTGTNPDEITLSGVAGEHFLVTANISLNQDANSSNRQNYEMRLALDGNEVEGTRVTTYIRGNPNADGTINGVLSYSGIITKQTGLDEILTLQLRRESEAAAATDIVGGETAISIVKLPITADYAVLGETGGGQDLSTSRTSITWDNTLEEDTGSFDHDSTNTERINIEQSDDYLFFSTLYAERGSTTDATRETQFLEWRIDGTTLVTHGNHGAFNRGDQGTGTDAYTSGSSGGVLLDGLADTQYIELTQINEALNGTSTYQAGRMSLQGVNISSLFATVANTQQLDFRWRDDSTDLNSDGGWLAAENSNSIGLVAPDNTYRIRVEVANVGGLAESAARSYELQWGLKPEAGACLDITNWYGSGDSSDDIDMVSTTHIDPDGETTSAGLLANIDGYIYVSGEGRDTADTTGLIGPLAAGRYTEVEYSIEPTASAALGGTYCFRLYDTNNSTELNAYNVYPEFTLVEPNNNQLHFRWRDDSTDLNTSGGWLATEDSNAIGNVNRYETYRLRFDVANTGNYQQLTAKAYELQWGEKQTGDLCSNVGTWTGMEDSATDEFEMVESTYIDPDGETTSSGLLANVEGYTFVSGEGKDTSDTTSAFNTLGVNEFTELEYSIQATDNAVTGNSYCFRLYNSTDTVEMDTYNSYPEVTLDSVEVTAGLVMEWGTQNNVSDDSWTTINFSNSYTSPVFVCTVEYGNNIGNESDGDADSVVCRVQNVGSTSVEVMLQEPGAPGSLTQPETIHWMVVEEGTYDTGDIKLEAFTYNSTVTDNASSWVGELQTYAQSYTNPVVLGQVMTYNDSNYSVFWAHDGSSGAPTSSNLYTGKHVAEDPTTTRANETIGVIVFEQANGSLGGVNYEVSLQTQTIDRIDDGPPSSYTFNQAFSATPEVAVTSLAGISGVNGGHPVLYDDGSGSLSTTQIDLAIMEEEINDTEQTGNTEYAPYIVFETSGSSGVSLDLTNYRFYSNSDNVQPGASLSAENTSLSDVAYMDVVRLRLAIQSAGGNIGSNDIGLTLQYGEGSNCSAVGTWNDVDSISGGGIWRGYNNATPLDGTTISSSLLNDQNNTLQTYEEQNDSGTNPNIILDEERGEWDWVIQNNGATANTNYCFRVVTSDDQQLVYSIYPQINTSAVAYTQSDFEWFVSQNSVTLSNVWPETGAGRDLTENEILTQLPGTNSPLAFGERIRIQINFRIANSPLSASEQSYKLQYGEGEDCTLIGAWNDVGAKGSGEAWRLYDESGLTDTVTQVNQITSSSAGAEGNYSEITPTAANPNAISIGQYSEWDFPIENNGANDNSSYCFRMVLDDDTTFDTYTNYPKIFTHPGMTVVMRHGNFYRNDIEQGFIWVD